MTMKIEIQSSKLIKPSIPTPETHRLYKIGFIDELVLGGDVRLVMFFPANSNDHNDPMFLTRLENSLAETLTRFHPLAGRYVKGMHAVDCNDQGALFIHAKTNTNLEEFLGSEVNLSWGDEFMPSEFDATDPILSVQVTVFECGGTEISVSLSHRIADASTLSTFLNAWAARNREENDAEFIAAGFESSSIYPSCGASSFDLGIPRSISNEVFSKYATKKLSFSESLISNIKAKAMVNGYNGAHKWSKVQVVQAIIWKALIGLDRVTHGSPRMSSVLCQPINLRERTASLIHKHSCGNICAGLTTESRLSETTEELADLIRDSVKKTINDYSKVRLDSPEVRTMIVNSFLQMTKFPDTTFLVAMSSWCRFPFYEVDFGFGKPTSINCGRLIKKNNTLLLDDVGGKGVEAFVCLEINDVPYFEEALDIEAFSAS